MTFLLRMLGALFMWGRRFETWCIRYYLLGRVGEAGRNISIGEHTQFYGSAHIRLGDNVILANRVTLRALTHYPWTQPPQTFSPQIDIQRGAFINNGCQISCANKVVIGEEVMLAENCFVADNNHGFSDPDRSIREQPLTVGGEVHIDEGAWLGANVCVLGAVHIGKHCVIGANAVVTRDIPPYSLAVGAPAKVIKQYDPTTKQWRPYPPQKDEST